MEVVAWKDSRDIGDLTKIRGHQDMDRKGVAAETSDLKMRSNQPEFETFAPYAALHGHDFKVSTAPMRLEDCYLAGRELQWCSRC